MCTAKSGLCISNCEVSNMVVVLGRHSYSCGDTSSLFLSDCLVQHKHRPRADKLGPR